MSLRGSVTTVAIHIHILTIKRTLFLWIPTQTSFARNDIGCLTCDVSRKQIPRLGRGGAKGAGAGCIKNIANCEKQNYNHNI